MILRTQSAVWSAARSALNETHEALTGDPFPDSVEDDAARVRLTMLMLRAQDFSAPGENPVDVVIQKGIRMENVYKPGTLAHELKAQIIDQAAKVTAEGKSVAEPRDVAPSATRNKFSHVVAIEGGTSRVGAASERGQVLALVRKAGDAGVTLAELDAALGKPTRGHVQKLIDKAHVKTVLVEEPAPAEGKTDEA